MRTQAAVAGLLLLSTYARADAPNPKPAAVEGVEDPSFDEPQPDPIPTARPIVSLDDTRSQGPTARNWFDVSVAPALMIGPQVMADGKQVSGTVYASTFQLSAGIPTFDVREYRDLVDRYQLSTFQVRMRGEVFRTAEDWLGGPMTFAAQRYFAIDPLAISPLVFAHVGIDVAFATPWVSGRADTPPATVQVLNGVDTELARNGWSLRPVTAYFRADFLACRSWYAELGAGPEAFVPTAGATEYDTRVRAAAGFSLGCHGNVSEYAPKLQVEYRGRIRMYAADASPDYRDQIGGGLQFDLGAFVLQVFYAADLGSKMADYATVGARLQLGRAK